uniref:Putative salivary c-type lectin n=1 Tax=Culex tarsalis TaxID=7177 RepID=A0A1Q3FPW5_CULTA
MLFKVVCILLEVVLLIATLGSAEANSTVITPNSNSSTQVKLSRAVKSGTKYIAFLENLNFFEAWQACESFGLRLAVVTSAADTNEIKVALNNVNAVYLWQFWIAGTDLGRSKSFLWITTGKQIWRPNFYLNWYPGEPNNAGGNEHCVEVYQESLARWNDRDCNVRHGFVCELVNPLC